MEHLIKRYRNRKLYDTAGKKYITLQDIAEMIPENNDIRVIDNDSGEDITRHILTQIILRQEAPGTAVPVDSLKTWITSGEDTIRKAFHKTLEFGRNVAGRVDIGLVPGVKDIERRVDLEILLRSFEKIYDWTAGRITGKLRKNLLNIPSREEWVRLNDKILLLENKIDKLIE